MIKFRLFIAWFCFILCLMPLAYTFANTPSNENFGLQRVEQIVINETDVCLRIGDVWLIADSLKVSKTGVFLLIDDEWISLSEAIANNDYQIRSWKCEKCGRYNLEGINGCAYCGKPKDKPKKNH